MGIPDHSILITSTNVFDSFWKSHPHKLKLLIASDKRDAPTIVRALSSDFIIRSCVSVGFVRKSNEQVIRRLKVTTFPTVLVLSTDVREEYKGQISFSAIKMWVSQQCLAKGPGIGEDEL